MLGSVVKLRFETPQIPVGTLDNPPINVLTRNSRRFAAVLDELDGDMEVRCIVITGTARSFCAGPDLRESGDSTS